MEPSPYPGIGWNGCLQTAGRCIFEYVAAASSDNLGGDADNEANESQKKEENQGVNALMKFFVQHL